MKKLITLILAMTLVLSLAACGGGEQTANLDDAPETSATADTTNETQETTNSTEEPTEATTPETTVPPTTEPDETKPTEITPPATEPEETKPADTTPTQPTHKHSYSSKVTKAATCTEKGIKTYTCTCGDTYTESIPTTAHSYTMKITADATGKDEGAKNYTCSCGDTYKETFKLSTTFMNTFLDNEKHETADGDSYYRYVFVGFSTSDGIRFAVNYQMVYYPILTIPTEVPRQISEYQITVELIGNEFEMTDYKHIQTYFPDYGE